MYRNGPGERQPRRIEDGAHVVGHHLGGVEPRAPEQHDVAVEPEGEVAGAAVAAGPHPEWRSDVTERWKEGASTLCRPYWLAWAEGDTRCGGAGDERADLRSTPHREEEYRGAGLIPGQAK